MVLDDGQGTARVFSVATYSVLFCQTAKNSTMIWISVYKKGSKSRVQIILCSSPFAFHDVGNNWRQSIYLGLDWRPPDPGATLSNPLSEPIKEALRHTTFQEPATAA